ncbi:Zn(2)-C6 fungal-type domain-containing protein [Mycena chlorophos]|uniref:Zn(2)-C6 fungal-type domain-containing protein n=1 Tax=Mycena chlorophos TaxID=658473 RepID=A0A8H6RXL7_MYCCL|nr:Zn(2)-C6 fungal-type domain-containing protein [Mycena chlorophos]
MSSTAAEGYKKPPRKRPPKPRTEPLRRGKACLNCRHLKIRCDGARPVCGPCTRVPKDDECEYTDGSSRTKSLEATIARLKARVSELENADSPPPRLPSDPELGRLGVSPSLSPAISSNASDVSGFPSSRDSESSHSFLGFQEPPPDMLEMLLDAFLPHCVQFGFFMHPARFRAAAILQLPLGHPARPSPALLCAVYLWGVHLSRSEPMVTYEGLFIRRAQQHIATELSNNVHPAHRIHTIQAHILLSSYFLRNKQLLEAEFHSNGAVTLALGYRIRIRSSRAPSPPLFGSASSVPETALPLPTDPVEEGERIRAFWMLVCHQTSLLMTIRTPGNTFSTLEAPGLQIDTPWPLELGEYELGMMSVDLRSCDTIDEFMVHGISGSASPFALQAQATVLLQRAIQLARRWSPGMQPQAVSAHASSSAWLETHIQQLQTQVSLVSTFYQQNEETRTLWLTQALLHASIIHLHKNNTGDTSTSLAAARGILAVFTDPEADASDDLSRAGPVVGTLILLACQLILREIERTRYLRASMGTTLNADAAYKQEEASLLVDLQNGLTTMTLFALDSPLGQYQLSKVQHKCDSLGL